MQLDKVPNAYGTTLSQDWWVAPIDYSDHTDASGRNIRNFLRHYSGDLNASQYVYDRDGWGGRLAYAINTANAVSVTHDISVFCNGIDPQNRNAKVVHANDTRHFGLSNGNANPASDSSRLARFLKGY